MDDRGHITTERRNPNSQRLDRLSSLEAVDLINGEDATVASAVAGARVQIAAAVELVVESLRGGGRLIYVGAGTSGRLGVLDAAECPPTFMTDPSMICGIIAGGTDALTRSVEGAEDTPAAAVADVDRMRVGRGDVVFGIATGGTTVYVHAAIARAKALGARTIFLACVPESEVADAADVSIRVLTGPEILTGSTRMKAGTATKMVLNMVTTATMVQLGKVFQNLMVDVNTQANRKLVDRGIRILSELTGAPRAKCAELLAEAGGSVKTALVMHWMNLDRNEAERRLDSCGGHVGRALGEVNSTHSGDVDDRTCNVA